MLDTTRTRILFVSANPASTGRLQLDEEVREIESRLQLSTHRDSFELIVKWAARPRDLLEHLNRYRPHIVHFSGHGSETEEIVLTNESGAPIPVSKAALVGLFTALKDEIRVVVLNACFSEVQASAITQQVDFAIGMTRAIGDRAAVVFASAFYSALGFGRSLGEAFDQGRLALLLEGIDEDRTPQLLVRAGADPQSTKITDPGFGAEKARQKKARPPRALIVEDDNAIRVLLSALLRREGYEVVTSGSAREAFSALSGGGIDIVLLDLELPDQNGLEVARQIGPERRPGVIFLTQRDSPADRIAGLRTGGDDYITKPFDPEELIARIESVLRRTSSLHGAD